MGNSQVKDLSSDKKELSNSNLGVINVSSADIAAIGPRIDRNKEGPQINELPQEMGQTDWDKYR